MLSSPRGNREGGSREESLGLEETARPAASPLLPKDLTQRTLHPLAPATLTARPGLASKTNLESRSQEPLSSWAPQSVPLSGVCFYYKYFIV